MRIKKENEEAERRKLEGAVQREQEQQEFIKEKEREILQLQVWFSVSSLTLCGFLAPNKNSVSLFCMCI